MEIAQGRPWRTPDVALRNHAARLGAPSERADRRLAAMDRHALRGIGRGIYPTRHTMVDVRLIDARRDRAFESAADAGTDSVFIVADSVTVPTQSPAELARRAGTILRDTL